MTAEREVIEEDLEEEMVANEVQKLENKKTEKYLSAEDGLRQFPKKRLIPEKRPKTFVLFPFEMHAKRKETFEQKEAESLDLIKNHLLKFKKCYVMSSHGSDSIIMVHLVMRAWRELVAEGHDIPKPKVWLNHTLNLFKEEKAWWPIINKFLDIEDVFKVFYPPKEDGKPQTVWSIAKKYGLPKFRRTSRGVKGSYKETNTPKCCDILKKKSVKLYLKSLPLDQRYDCVFIGTRAQESQNRSMVLLQNCRSYLKKYRGAYPMRTLTPLSFWEAVDVLEYYHRYNIPRNPVYKAHNVDRMGCASCPAHIGWEERLAKDPTEEGFGMLKQNLKILQETDVPRFEASIASLQKYLKKPGTELLQANRTKLIKLLAAFTHAPIMEDYLH